MRNAITVLIIFTGLATSSIAEHWPQMRGPQANAHADGASIPLEFSETQHVKWKTPIDGQGWSSPVIWGDQIWMTSATEDGRQRFAVAVDRESGHLIHRVKVFDVPNPEPKNDLNSYASCSPVIENGRVYVHFGTDGTACVDTQSGRIIWRRDDIKLDHMEGAGSSPILYEDLLIFHCDGTDVQYVIALDKHTGRTVWKTDRSADLLSVTYNVRKAFCTPLVIDVDGTKQLISVGAQAVYSYEPTTGREIWRVGFDGFSNAPMPLFGHGLVFVTTGFPRPHLIAIDPTGRGDVTDSHIVWRYERTTVPKKPTPVLVDDLIYMINDDGIASCVEAKTGEEVWVERMGGQYSASPLYVEGRLYFFSQEGKTTVLEPSRRYHVLATNWLDDGFMASPAVVGRAMYLRTKSNLYRIEQ